MNILWDMETGDPDDFVTLLLLLGHPRVNLLGVTITPGTPDQVGVVRAALGWFGRTIPVGVFNLDHTPPSGNNPGEGRQWSPWGVRLVVALQSLWRDAPVARCGARPRAAACALRT